MTELEFDRLVDDRVAAGVFTVHCDVFRSQQIFDLEMKYIFEQTWVFLGAALQAPDPHEPGSRLLDFDRDSTWIKKPEC